MGWSLQAIGGTGRQTQACCTLSHGTRLHTEEQTFRLNPHLPAATLAGASSTSAGPMPQPPHRASSPPPPWLRTSSAHYRTLLQT